MDFSRLQSYLNDPKKSWEHLRHLKPVLLNAVRNKNMKVVAEFLNNKTWGVAYHSEDLVQTMANSHWPEGWDLLIKKAIKDGTLLGHCLDASRPNPKMFERTLNEFWSAYTNVSPRTKKHQKFLSGAHQIVLSAIRFNDHELYMVCKEKLKGVGYNKDHMSPEYLDAARRFMCCWAIDDLMRSSTQPHHYLDSFLKLNSFTVDDQDLLQLCQTLLDVSPKESSAPYELVNSLFNNGVAYFPVFLQLCNKIDENRPASDGTLYSPEIFKVGYSAYFAGNMSKEDAIYWCSRVWQQRIDNPSSGAGALGQMLNSLLNASAAANRWDLVLHFVNHFSEEYDILIDQIVRSGKPERWTVDKMLHNISEKTDHVILKSTYVSPIIQALREKVQLEEHIGTQSSIKRSKKI